MSIDYRYDAVLLEALESALVSCVTPERREDYQEWCETLADNGPAWDWTGDLPMNNVVIPDVDPVDLSPREAMAIIRQVVRGRDRRRLYWDEAVARNICRCRSPRKVAELLRNMEQAANEYDDPELWASWHYAHDLTAGLGPLLAIE